MMLFAFVTSVMILSYFGILYYSKIASRFGIVDMPSARRVNKIPVIRGGGIAFLPIAFLGLISYISIAEKMHINILTVSAILSLLLCLVYFYEDIANLHQIIRFVIQAICIGVVMIFFHQDLSIFYFFDHGIDILITSFLWLWFVNLYNFMDGSDGMTSVNTITILASIAVVSYLSKIPLYEIIVLLSIFISSCMVIFAKFNWHPAKIFIGDCGTISIGFIIGAILIYMANHLGIIIPFMIPAYYIADATMTILIRLINGEKIWEPHLKHFFQIAILNGCSHQKIAFISGVSNAISLSMSIVLLYHNHLGVKVSAVLVVILCNIFILKYFKNYGKN